MLKIYGRANSANVQKVTFACDEMGVAFDRADVGGQHGGNDTPEYLGVPRRRVTPVEEGSTQTVVGLIW